MESPKKRGIISNPYWTSFVSLITKPTKKGPKIAHIFPNIENAQKAEIWFFDLICLAITLLLDAWIGPIKNPMINAIIQKINTFLTKYKDIVQMNSEIMQIEIILLEPILSSIRPREKQPTIPNKFINTPRNNISDSVRPNKNDANIPANAKILTTALLKKK